MTRCFAANRSPKARTSMFREALGWVGIPGWPCGSNSVKTCINVREVEIAVTRSLVREMIETPAVEWRICNDHTTSILLPVCWSFCTMPTDWRLDF